MSWIEIVLITIGMSLDTFAAVECQGALVAKLEKKRLSMAVTVIALWQTIALLIGSFLVTLLNQYDTQLSGEAFIGRILAILILFGMGLRMFVKAWRNERIVEKREDGLDIKKPSFRSQRNDIHDPDRNRICILRGRYKSSIDHDYLRHDRNGHHRALYGLPAGI